MFRLPSLDPSSAFSLGKRAIELHPTPIQGNIQYIHNYMGCSYVTWGGRQVYFWGDVPETVTVTVIGVPAVEKLPYKTPPWLQKIRQ
jgi:hypothetical protein